MRWKIKAQPEEKYINLLQKELNVNRIIALLLLQRGITNYTEAKSFFRPRLEALHDPFIMKDMAKAVSRIEQAISNHENILVYGDYDVDGTTAVALVASYLKTKTPNVATYIPDRYTEGYGISNQGIDFASDNNFSLIIALDCGIKAIDKVAYATHKQIDFIICDHHRPGNTVPDAVAILDPKQKDCPYPFKDLCGCGVGFKLAQAIAIKNNDNFNTLIPYLDLVATAIGADIVPITGENRILSHYGLQVINTSPRPGFKAIIELLKKQTLSITDVVFTIAPRINAAGRMKHGQYAVNLLTETDYEAACKIAKEIDTYNTERRQADKQITAEALNQINTLNETANYTSVVYNENWHKGVIGIVASRLIETYYRPTLVFTKSGDKLAASARSVKGFDVYNALEACSEHIEQFGGHKYAAGLTLKPENYNRFKTCFETVVKNTIDPKLLQPEISIDTTINLSTITPKFYRILKQFAPFGPENMSPIFLTKQVKDTGYTKAVGETNKHLRISIFDTPNKVPVFTGIGFNLSDKWNRITNKQNFKIVYSIDENHWQNKVTLQLKLKDIKP